MEAMKEMKAEMLPSDYNQYDLSFKMIMIGDAGTGKSCLSLRASKDVFENSYVATVGFEMFTLNVKIDGKVIKLQIWDTCGQEIYRNLISSFYRNASLAMLVYGIDSKQSFAHIEEWLKELKLQSYPEIKIMLIGNKADLEDQRQVQISEAKHFKEENKLHFFCETSAKNGLNAKEIFFEAAKLLYDDHLKYKARANKISDLKLIQKINDSSNQLREENEEDKEEEGKKEEEKEEEEEEEEKEEEEKEEEEGKKEAKISDNIKEKKCSIEEHSNINSNSFCQKCEIFMCNKCEEYHSHLFKNHNLIKLNENKDEDIFTGICKE